MKLTKYDKSAELFDRAKIVLAGGVSSEFRKYSYPHALFYTHGKGSHIFDADGNDYLDFTLSQGPLILGHAHPHVAKSVQEYSDLGQLFAGQHIKELELAEKLHALIPSADLMRFCLDGSEAVQTAFRVARSKTGRQKFLRFEGHYHGWLDNVCWGISGPSLEELGNYEQPKVLPWTKGLPDGSGNEQIVLPWNNLDLVRERVRKDYKEIAAIITEPVMCNNGCIVAEDDFLSGLRDICDEFGIALIFDEVITGFRMSLGGAQQYFGVTPDLSIFAKAMGSGYPISAIVGKREWMDEITEGRAIHAGTMNSSNSTVAASLATIEVLEREQPYERLFSYGLKLMAGLRKAAEDHGHEVIVQGPGPMFAISFTHVKNIKDYRDTLKADKGKLNEFIKGMQEHGIRIIGRGLWYISTAHVEADIDTAIDAAKQVMGKMNGNT